MPERNLITALALAVGLVAALAEPTTVAQADETGFAGIHQWRKVGRKTCLVDHQHSGSGSGPTQKQAEAATIAAWVGFTDLEYGSSWSNYRLAIEKRMSCSRDGAGYACTLDATPCRGW